MNKCLELQCFCSLMSLTSEKKKTHSKRWNNSIDKNLTKKHTFLLNQLFPCGETSKAIQQSQWSDSPFRKKRERRKGNSFILFTSKCLSLFRLFARLRYMCILNLIFMCVFPWTKRGSDGHLCRAICCNDRHLSGDERIASRFLFLWTNVVSSVFGNV